LINSTPFAFIRSKGIVYDLPVRDHLRVKMMQMWET